MFMHRKINLKEEKKMETYL